MTPAAAQLSATLTRLGGRLTTVNGQIAVEAPCGILTDELVAALGRHKLELESLIYGSSQTPEPPSESDATHPQVLDISLPCETCARRDYWFNLYGVPICRTCCPPTAAWEDAAATAAARCRSKALADSIAVDVSAGFGLATFDWDATPGYFPNPPIISNGMRHKRGDCPGRDDWQHVSGERYCLRCWPPIDSAAIADEPPGRSSRQHMPTARDYKPAEQCAQPEQA
jgi:hypothetical protein